MKTIIGIALIVFSMIAAEHMIYPYWLFMLPISLVGGMLIGVANEKSDSETHVAEGRDTR